MKFAGPGYTTGCTRLIRSLNAAFFLAVVSLAVGQTPSPNQSNTFSAETCGRADPAYIRTANETGGIPMFLQRSEAAKAFHLLRESTRNNVATVFWATGTIKGKTQIFKIPVDSVTQRITFTFSGDTKGDVLNLTSPSGQELVESAARAEITDLSCGRIITVTSPDAGGWHAEIRGSGRYWIEVQAQSDIYFVSAEFVKTGGRPGHEGLFRTQGQPVAGTSPMFQASLSAKPTKTTEFYSVTEQGEILQKLPLRATNSDREFLEFVGSIDLPKVPFRVAVMGLDTNGKPYQRFLSKLFHAENVEVLSKPDFDQLQAGSTKRLLFTVRNTEASRNFKITVADAHQFVSAVEPKELNLRAGESGAVLVTLTVPVSVAEGVGDDIVFVAASLSGPPTSNSNIVHFTVSH